METITNRNVKATAFAFCVSTLPIRNGNSSIVTGSPSFSHSLVSTLPIRNGNSSPFSLFFSFIFVSTLPIRNGNISYILTSTTLDNQSDVSTLPIRNGNCRNVHILTFFYCINCKYLTYKEWKHCIFHEKILLS